MVNVRTTVEQKFDSVVLLAPFPWHEVWQSTHYIAEYLSRRVPVLYVEPSPMWFPNSDLFSARRLIRMLGAGRLRRRSATMSVLVPRSAPFGRSLRVRGWMDRLYAQDVARACDRLGWHRPLYWTFNDSIKKIGTSAAAPYFVYHCLDLYRDTEAERETARSATAILTVSNALQERHHRFNSRCFVVPNGIDVELFRSCPRERYNRPADVPDRKPVIGYAGTISSHTDLMLMQEVARTYPTCETVLVGPVLKGQWGPQGKQKRALDALRSCPNVRLLGERSVVQLPGYLQSFDVCVLPSLLDEWSRHADPLKFLQYLAMGKPAVAMRLPSVESYADLCYLADSSRSFVSEVGRALGETPYEETARRRRAAVSIRSWDIIIDRACQILRDEGCVLPDSRPLAIRAGRPNDKERHASA